MSYNLLKGKRGIITGALNESSIAWFVAERAVEEGAEIVLTNAPISLRMGKINELAEKLNTIVIPADATSTDDIENLYTKASEHFGGEKIDFILHSIGMSPNVRKGREYNDLNYDFFQKSIDISALSFHKMMQVADKMDVLNEGASIVGLSYIAAQRAYPDYGDMSQAKAVLESIARSFGQKLGEKKGVRVNTISQSPTVTTAGQGITGFDVFVDFADMLSPLGNASALECADYVITLFSDLTRKVTMQNLFHDGGFSTAGISHAMVDRLSK
ncbi:enoyl-ACP reductase FabI [Algivirga pacifica]|uniref:Enoyl-[acyl-carrier-protein] reductase [NADH] n=1 Tax=Algivirga pacifica TaxID=1162670 RepID=A0ABP9DC73_9BACT